jgi:hypothetical protein
MSRLQHFLDELTDYELLQFRNYRYEQFLKGSKEKIDAEFEKRELDPTYPSAFKKALSEPLAEFCPRCESSKFYNATEIETITYSYASVDLEVDYRTCLVYMPKKVIL